MWIAQKIYEKKDGIFRSSRPPISLPQQPNTSMVPFLFNNISPINSNSPALIDAETSQTLTFLSLETHVSRLSSALLDRGISNNDVILILSRCLPTPSISPLLSWQCACSLYTVSDLSKQIKDSNPKLVKLILLIYDWVLTSSYWLRKILQYLIDRFNYIWEITDQLIYSCRKNLYFSSSLHI